MEFVKGQKEKLGSGLAQPAQVVEEFKGDEPVQEQWQEEEGAAQNYADQADQNYDYNDYYANPDDQQNGKNYDE